MIRVLWRRLRRWGVRRRTDRALRKIVAKHQRIEALQVARRRLETAVRLPPALPPGGRHELAPRLGPRGNNGHRRHEAERLARAPFTMARSPPNACCHEYGIVTGCDGVTDVVVCGVCRTRFQRPCPDGPIVASPLD